MRLKTICHNILWRIAKFCVKQPLTIYTKQYIHDINNLKEIILKAQELVNDCNESLFLISSASVQNHVYNFGEIEENKNGEN